MDHTFANGRHGTDEFRWEDFQTASDRSASARASHARQSQGRSSRVDPTTCERDDSAAEIEFLRAIRSYQQSSGRKFPTWSEALSVLRALGYSKPS